VGQAKLIQEESRVEVLVCVLGEAGDGHSDLGWAGKSVFVSRAILAQVDTLYERGSHTSILSLLVCPVSPNITYR
jgi:hypothetical protein